MKPATRLERAQALTAAVECRAAGQSERALATALGRPRSTLREWAQADVASAEVPGALAALFASVEGVQWLHRLVLALHFVITLRAGGGVRLVCECLELSGLSAFVGASYGSQQGLNAALEQAVVAIAAEQRAALAAGMAPRAVTVCEDETFHPAICLVALEPVSGFILLEQSAPAPHGPLQRSYAARGPRRAPAPPQGSRHQGSAPEPRRTSAPRSVPAGQACLVPEPMSTPGVTVGCTAPQQCWSGSRRAFSTT